MSPNYHSTKRQSVGNVAPPPQDVSPKCGLADIKDSLIRHADAPSLHVIEVITCEHSDQTSFSAAKIIEAVFRIIFSIPRYFIEFIYHVFFARIPTAPVKKHRKKKKLAGALNSKN